MMATSRAGLLCHAWGARLGKASLACSAPGDRDPIQIPILSPPAPWSTGSLQAASGFGDFFGFLWGFLSLGFFGDGCDSVNVFGRRRSPGGNTWLLRAFFSSESANRSLEGRG